MKRGTTTCSTTTIRDTSATATTPYTDTNANNTVFTIPPSSVPSIGDDLLANNISWKYYGDQWNNYVPDPYQLNYGAIGARHG